jgi:hypothetical protein
MTQEVGELSKKEKADIVLAEYKFLREEILQKMDSCWKILTFEVGSTSLLFSYVFVNNQYSLLPVIPFLILITSFLHMGETLAIINAGSYIRNHTEKDLRTLLKPEENNPNLLSLSWESYTQKPEKAYCYRLIHVSTSLLFIGLFLATIAIMIMFKLNSAIIIPYDWNILLPFIILYVLGFIVYLYVWIKRIVLWQ